MSTSQMAQRTTVILNGLTDWDEWLEIVKTKAVGGEVQEFVDPAMAKEELPALKEPIIPTLVDVDSQKTTLSQLNSNKKEMLRLL